MSNLAEIPNECFDAPTESPDAMDLVLDDPFICIQAMTQADKDDVLYEIFLQSVRYVRSGKPADRDEIGCIGYRRTMAEMQRVAKNMDED